MPVEMDRRLRPLKYIALILAFSLPLYAQEPAPPARVPRISKPLPPVAVATMERDGMQRELAALEQKSPRTDEENARVVELRNKIDELNKFIAIVRTLPPCPTSSSLLC
jgi:hypothetical protein